MVFPITFLDYNDLWYIYAWERGISFRHSNLMDIVEKHSFVVKFAWCEPLDYHAHLLLTLRDRKMVDVSYCIEPVVPHVDEGTRSILEKAWWMPFLSLFQ